MCVTCLDAPKDALLLPCKHLCLCGRCADNLEAKRDCAGAGAGFACPICREPVQLCLRGIYR